MSNVEQIIETAKKQHERGELSIFELNEVSDRWGVNLIIDGDHLKKNTL